MERSIYGQTAHEHGVRAGTPAGTKIRNGGWPARRDIPPNRADAEGATNVIMEQNNEIQTRVLDLLCKKVGAARPIDLDSSVVEDTGLDSVSIMDFVMELEDEFDITIPLDQIAEVRTVGDLANAVQARSRENGAAEGGPTGEGH